jgi:hypothetical protein
VALGRVGGDVGYGIAAEAFAMRFLAYSITQKYNLTNPVVVAR